MTKHRVIIFSLHDSTADFIEGIFVSMGWQVSKCDNAEQMIAACQRVQPLLVVILNHSLLLNGAELIHHIRPRGQHRPLIYVISWQQSEQVVLSLLEIGINQYMTLPICIHRLQAKIAQL